MTKLNDALQIFYTTRKGNQSATLIPRVVGRRRPVHSEIQRAIDGVRTLPLSAPKGGSKSDFFAFEYKSTADRLKRCELRSPVSGINI